MSTRVPQTRDRRLGVTGAGACREVRRSADADRSTQLQGYGAVFDDETVIAGLFRERIAPGAFKESITHDDVVAAFNHNSHYVLGRTSAGTLRLEEDRHGLRYEIDLNPKDPEAMRIGAIVARGDVRGSSFAFEIARDADEAWDYSPMKQGLLPLRTIKRARLFELGPVTFPAYPTTSVSARTLQRVAALRGVPLDVLERELWILEQELACIDRHATATRAYAPGYLGTLEREQELNRLEFGL